MKLADIKRGEYVVISRKVYKIYNISYPQLYLRDEKGEPITIVLEKDVKIENIREASAMEIADFKATKKE